MKFVAPDRDHNCSISRARRIVAKLAALGQPAYGIFAVDGHLYLPEVDFAANNVPEIANLVIKTVDRPDDPENPIPAHDDYQNAGQIAEQIDSAPNAYEAARRLLAMGAPGITDSEIEARISSLPGVRAGYAELVERAWSAIG